MPPTVTDDKCVGCGACVDACPADVLELKDDIAIVPRPDDCVECGACEDACPADAIHL